MMERTKKLDEHWHGQFWCMTCQFYTGQLEQHHHHFVESLPIPSYRWGNIVFWIDEDENIQEHNHIRFRGKRVQ